MSGTVSTRWYFTDWISDQNVRACSLAARGLWMDMLCIAGGNKGRDYGFVVIAGKALGAKELGRHVGSSESEVEPLLVELEENEVFNRDRRGIIYCRRMVRAEKNRTNGRLGGNPNLMKNKSNPSSVQLETKALIPEPEPEPKKDSTAAPPKAAKRATPRTRIPERAVLVEGPNMDFALSKGFSPRDASAMFEEFRDYHVGKGNQMADWAAAWRTWVRNQIKFKRGGSNGKTESSDLARASFSGLAARVRYGPPEPDRPAPEDLEPINRR